MYSLRLVERDLGCSLCGAQIARGGFAGHHYNEPLCRECFRQAAPEVAEAWTALPGHRGDSLQELESGETRCGRCGRPVGCWVGGFSGRTPLCRRCLGRTAPRLAALLVLDDGARELGAAEGDPAEMACLARAYVEYLEGA